MTRSLLEFSKKGFFSFAFGEKKMEISIKRNFFLFLYRCCHSHEILRPVIMRQRRHEDEEEAHTLKKAEQKNGKKLNPSCFLWALT